MDFNEKNATEAVLNSFAGIKDNRLKEIMSSIITHLHEVVKEVEPTEEEWMIEGKNLYFYLTSWVFQCY